MTNLLKFPSGRTKADIEHVDMAALDRIAKRELYIKLAAVPTMFVTAAGMATLLYHNGASLSTSLYAGVATGLATGTAIMYGAGKHAENARNSMPSIAAIRARSLDQIVE